MPQYCGALNRERCLTWNPREEKVGLFSWQQLEEGGVSEQSSDEVYLARPDSEGLRF